MNTPTTATQKIEITARLIRDTRTVITEFNTNDALKLITTNDVLMGFPELKCILYTSRDQGVISNKITFVVLLLPNGDEKAYVMHFQVKEGTATKCFCYESLREWDKDAKLVKL